MMFEKEEQVRSMKKKKEINAQVERNEESKHVVAEITNPNPISLKRRLKAINHADAQIFPR